VNSRMRTDVFATLFAPLALLCVLCALALGMAATVPSSSVASAANADCTKENAKDKKSVNPECAKSGRLNVTDKDAQQAGITPRSADSIVTQLLNAVYILSSIIAVIAIVIAGISIITADGDPAKVAQARKAITYAMVGLVIVGSAFIITGIVQGIGTK